MATYEDMKSEQTIKILETDWIREDDGSIVGPPMFNGMLTFCKITKAITKAEEKDPETSALCYQADHETLASNYMLAFISDKGSQLLYDASDLVRICDLEEADISILNKWLMDLGLPTSGLPVTATKVDVETNDGTKPAIVFANIYEFMVQEEDNQRADAEYEFRKVHPDATDEEVAVYVGKYITSAQEMLRRYPDMKDNCDNHMFIRSALAKLAGLIQKRYNQIHFDDRADWMAQQIAAIRYFNDKGEIVPLSITALENFLNRIKDNIRIQ